ncbi:MAG: KTSC domain-containing protein [Candidatus Omnitrophica bacterium]|nr:KTSC domain-containing protein [Candidatus Omnitrophota bacterium]
MEHVAVRSRDIAIVGYDKDVHALEIAFRSGGVYRYLDVPEGVYQALMSAPSYGNYFRDYIKNNFKYEKVS